MSDAAHLVMFDVDGTLIQSFDLDSELYVEAVQSVLKRPFSIRWEDYENVTDAGILDEILSENGFKGNRDAVHRTVREGFYRKVEQHLDSQSIAEVSGASWLLEELRARTDVVVAIATGGWEETARLKLASAQIDVQGFAWASASDATSRREIMRCSEARSGIDCFLSKTYVGDGLWDRKAARRLGYRFLLVGRRFEHRLQVDDYSDRPRVLRVLGLESPESMTEPERGL